MLLGSALANKLLTTLLLFQVGTCDYNVVGEISTANCTLGLDSTKYANGFHTFTADARNVNKQVGTSPGLVVYFNNSPSVTILTPANGVTVTKNFLIQATAKPIVPGFPITLMDVQVDGKVIGTSLQGSIAVAWNPVPKNVTVGPHKITVRAWDSATPQHQGLAEVTVYKAR